MGKNESILSIIS
uniref:Uncharacterized protein n=1 Tax=Arundo donax TaxID=35708 RepID=A0A0A8YHH0_ARUDO